MWYYVANANQLLVVTGFGIPQFSLKKKKFVWPLQKCNRFSFTPLNYELQIQALSHEKLAVKIQTSLTIGPDIDSEENITKYVKLLVTGENESGQEQVIRDRIVGIIEGEVRAVAASMSLEELFNDRKRFQTVIMNYISEALEKYGCVLYNANIEELQDTSGYFATVGQKAQEGAISAAKVAVAESKMKGDIGSQEHTAKSAKETSRLKAETTVFENQQSQTIAGSKAELDVKIAQFQAQVEIAKIEAQKSAQMRDSELQKEVEKKRAAVETERLRADEYAKAQVESEKIKTIADAKAYEKQVEAEASLYEMQRIAEGKLFQKMKESEGVQAMYTAQAQGLNQLIKSFENPKLALQYLMLEKGLYQQLAQENAKAIQGLQPKFNIWTTGSEMADPAKPLRDIYSTLPPLMSTIAQTGLGNYDKNAASAGTMEKPVPNMKKQASAAN